MALSKLGQLSTCWERGLLKDNKNFNLTKDNSLFDISTCVQNDVATCDDKVRRKSINLPVSQFLVLVTNYHVLRISSAVTSLILSASLKLVGGWMCTYWPMGVEQESTWTNEEEDAAINWSGRFALCHPLEHVWGIHNAHFTASYSKSQLTQYKLIWPQHHWENKIFRMTWMWTKFPVFQIALNVTPRISFL